jgi:hypothetical protein
MFDQEPFMTAEISYRHQRVAEDFKKSNRRRHHRTLRRRHLRLPQQRRGSVIVA